MVESQKMSDCTEKKESQSGSQNNFENWLSFVGEMGSMES